MIDKVTESSSHYHDLEKMSISELLTGINREDQTVPLAVEKAIPQIGLLVQAVVERMQRGGRLFYIGAGTSGRLGVVDASEIPPTYGAPPEWVVGIIAGGDEAIRKSKEGAEDSATQAWEDLKAHQINENDFVLGIAASGTTPYVVQGLLTCRSHGIATGCISCNPGAPLVTAADYPVVAVVGPEFVTGSTRMKSGTAQKLILNMISTTTMIRLGRVRGNRMVDMQLSNVKLLDRGVKMVMESAGIEDYALAKQYIEQYGSVRAAVDAALSGTE